MSSKHQRKSNKNKPWLQMDKHRRKGFILLYWFVTGLGLCFLLSGILIASGLRMPTAVATLTPVQNSKLPVKETKIEPKVEAQVKPHVKPNVKPKVALNAASYPLKDYLPTTAWEGTKLPNWNQVTFGSFPGISQGGSFQASSDVIKAVGYDPSRIWLAGQTPDQYMKLGDFQQIFELQNFSLNNIMSLTGFDLGNLSLADFGLMSSQTLGSLVDAIPDLERYTIEQLQPVFGLLSINLASSFDPTETLGDFLAFSPHLRDLSFDTLDLSGYTLDSLPGIDVAPLAAFKDWQNTNIAQVPGLSQVPFSQFPNPIQAQGSAIGILDIAFGIAESQRYNTISGSDQEGFKVPCDSECAHIELAGQPSIKGKQWISGKYQEVQGGSGFLGQINDGMEPTGRHPFGDAFKVVVWDTSETEGSAGTALFFRYCIRNTFVDLGCTPYFIGPVPFLSYQEKDPIFLGLL
ncbi:MULTISPECIES: hypothetical protein [Moorena]|uniref:Uncharacterized protein n=1 Tax=Moorena producens 3L TaxID=489825 RepID=F4XX89_9CYAN|nr:MULTISPECIES: hypothetical protein [Moorena]NES80908.1 hypothetical protein [Moorena sp. SIO2B7]EGJ30748.1 hypothetical protein LYNGBM3L_46570 [Moorena producens 3L]NEP31007.1 hypothetical protein [Moorena sp. SIO3B2]NEP65300.1 hypothetical protein [Moorena sp. SIO3A5]NEQ04557.1 hypothetical protein [Moorena sp. SIO4E2]